MVEPTHLKNMLVKLDRETCSDIFEITCAIGRVLRTLFEKASQFSVFHCILSKRPEKKTLDTTQTHMFFFFFGPDRKKP